MRVHDFAKARLSCPADGLLDRAAVSRTKFVHLDAVKLNARIVALDFNLADRPHEPRVPLNALDAHLNLADVMLENHERFLDIAHVSAKRGNLGRNLILSVVHSRQFLARLKQLVAHFMLLGTYVMLLGAQTVEFLQDVRELLADEA
jgi:hypothetical protein